MRSFSLYFLLALIMAEAHSSLLKIFAIDLTVIESDQLSQQDCKSFQVINAHFACNCLQQKVDSLKKYRERKKTDPEKITEKEKEIAELRAAFYQQVDYLETDYSLTPICLDCSLVEGAKRGQLDAIEELQKQLFCDHQNENTHRYDKSSYCHCVENRSRKLSPLTPPTAKDIDDFEKSWAQDLGRRIFGGISSTIYQIGNAVAENKILGDEFDSRALSQCNVTKIRTFLEQVTSKGCANGKSVADVQKRLKRLFPTRYLDADSFSKHFEDLALAVTSSGLPPTPDPEGECHLPRQMQMQYSKVMSLGAIEEIYHAIELLLNVIPEDVIAGIYHHNPIRPFDRVLEFALQRVDTGEVLLPEGVSELAWSQAIVGGLSMMLQTGEGAKISNTIQSWKGLQTFINGMRKMKDNLAPPTWVQGNNDRLKNSFNRDVLEFLDSKEINQSLNLELNNHCKNVFGDALEKAVCDPLGAPPDLFFLDNMESERFVQTDALFCKEPSDSISDFFGIKSIYFSNQHRSVDQDLNDLYDQGMGISYETFNQLCPLLKTCKEDRCFFNKASTIGPEALAELSPELQNMVGRLVQAEDLYQKIKTREVASVDPDDLFAAVTKGKEIDINRELLDSSILTVRAVWEYGEKEAKVVEENRIVNKRIPNMKKAGVLYESDFVNQFTAGVSSFDFVAPPTDFKVAAEQRKKATPMEENDSHEGKRELKKSLETLKQTYQRLQAKEKHAQQLYNLTQKNEVSGGEYQRAVLEQERSSLHKERSYLEEISRLSRENIEIERQQLKRDRQLYELQQGLERTDGRLRRQQQEHQNQQEVLARALDQKEREANQLRERLAKELGQSHPQVERVTPEINKNPASPPSSSGGTGFRSKTKRRQEKEKEIANFKDSDRPSFSSGGDAERSLPLVNSRDYLSLERGVKILSHGVSQQAPRFTLLTTDAAGELLKIPMKAEFNDKGEIINLIPDLLPEHHALIGSIGDKLVRQDLLAAIQGQHQIPIVSGPDFLTMSEAALIESVGTAGQFNLHLKSKEGLDLLLPFKVLRRGTPNQNVILNLVTSNYHWVKNSLEAVEDKRLLEKIYAQMAREDQLSSGK